MHAGAFLSRSERLLSGAALIVAFRSAKSAPPKITAHSAPLLSRSERLLSVTALIVAFRSAKSAPPKITAHAAPLLSRSERLLSVTALIVAFRSAKSTPPKITAHSAPLLSRSERRLSGQLLPYIRFHPRYRLNPNGKWSTGLQVVKLAAKPSGSPNATQHFRHFQLCHRSILR